MKNVDGFNSKNGRENFINVCFCCIEFCRFKSVFLFPDSMFFYFVIFLYLQNYFSHFLPLSLIPISSPVSSQPKTANHQNK